MLSLNKAKYDIKFSLNLLLFKRGPFIVQMPESLLHKQPCLLTAYQ